MPTGPVTCPAVEDLLDQSLTWTTGSSPATASVGPTSSAAADTLRFTMAGSHFSLATDALGIKVEIEWAVSDPEMGGSVGAIDVTVQLTYGGAPIGSNRGTSTQLPTSLAFTTYGGLGDNWGTGGLPIATANASDFGVDVQITLTGAGSPEVDISLVRITLYQLADEDLDNPAVIAGSSSVANGCNYA